MTWRRWIFYAVSWLAATALGVFLWIKFIEWVVSTRPLA